MMPKKLLLSSLLLVCSPVKAQTDLMETLYITELPEVVADSERSFSLLGELGLLFTQGNTDTSTITTSLVAEHDLEKWSNRYKTEVLYRQQKQMNDGVTEEVTTAHRLYFTAKMDYKLNNPDKRLFLFADYEDDRFDDFEYQSSIAAGWSQKLWEMEHSEFIFSLGPGFAMSPLQNKVEDVDEQSVILRGAMEFSYEMSDTSKFRQFFSTEADGQGAKSRSESELTANLLDYLAMKLSFVMRHDDNVSKDVKKLDTQTAVTLVYQFF